ncbi:MAG: hypothetical protein FJ290_00965 [Planctomycetes bacterium]|nr:hypothetical protein [Planctomycetota bacterium]
MTAEELERRYVTAPEAEAVFARLAEGAGGGVKWLWPGRIPLGKVSLLVGDPGLGKSLLALDMAARVSRGLLWPDGGGTAPSGRVLVLSAEDDADDTIRPRLEALGGDPMKVAALRVTGHPGRRATWAFSMARDLPEVADAMVERGDVRLVVLDPLNAYLGRRDTGSSGAVLAAMAPLQALAAGTGAAVLGISHLNKRATGPMLYRAMGNVALVAASRSAWGAVADAATPGRRLLLPLKCNLAAPPPGLAYRIVPSTASPGVPVVAWEAEPVQWTADEAMARAAAPTRCQEVVQWLRELLAGGAMLYREIANHARAAGFTPNALRDAKQALGVVHYHDGYGTRWLWRLREQPRPRPEGATEAPGAAETPPAAGCPAAG